MKIRPGRTRSLISGVMALFVTIFGAVMLSAAPGGIFGFFRWIWIAFGLIIAAASFYNAFSKHGISLYEIDRTGDRTPRGAPEWIEERGLGEEAGKARFCPNCGKPVSERARFCKFCGEPLEEQ
jgi:hypothetical protein